MILKKPYAFFIKNFKLFHLLMCIPSAVLLYRTSLIFGFIKEYGRYFSPQNRADLKLYFSRYGVNSKETLNMFKPIFTKYDIKFVENKLGVPK
jgi:hypothetical protein